MRAVVTSVALGIFAACQPREANDGARAEAKPTEPETEPMKATAAGSPVTRTEKSNAAATIAAAAKPDPPVADLVRYSVSGRDVGESFSVAPGGAYTLDVADDGLPVATGVLTADELSRVLAAVAATSGVAPPTGPEQFPSEPPPVFGVTTADGTASAFRGADMPGPWGALAGLLAELARSHLPEPAFVATLAQDTLTLTHRGAAATPACFAVAEAVVFGRGDALIRRWESPPIDPGATMGEAPHGPKFAVCTPEPRAPGWTVTVPMSVGRVRRGETLYVTVYAIVAGEHATISVE